MEKSIDFNELDIKAFLKAYYESFKSRSSKVAVRNPKKPKSKKIKDKTKDDFYKKPNETP